MAQSVQFLSVPMAVSAAGTSLCIGNFDGCHLGHQALLKNALDLAHQHHVVPMALTFDPHPTTIFQPHAAFQPLFTPEQKRASLMHFGMKEVAVVKFDQALRELSPESFIHDILIQRMNVKHLTIGYDFRFGKNRAGDATVLQQVADRGAFSLTVIAACQHDNAPVSSSRIRSILSESGDCKFASTLLGHPHAVVGTIRSGKQLGRTIGFPTINVHDTTQLLPNIGVYAGYVALGVKADNLFTLDSLELYPAMFNIGRRPTVEDEGAPIKLEAHLVDATFAKDALYDLDCTCIFTARLRDELKFPSLDALKTQIKRDVELGKAVLLKEGFIKRPQGT